MQILMIPLVMIRDIAIIVSLAVLTYSITAIEEGIKDEDCFAVYHGEIYKPTKGRSIELEPITEFREGQVKVTDKGLECHFGKLTNVHK